jgi:hypothetical protein
MGQKSWNFKRFRVFPQDLGCARAAACGKCSDPSHELI